MKLIVDIPEEDVAGLSEDEVEALVEGVLLREGLDTEVSSASC